MTRVLRDSTFYLMGNIASRLLGFVAIPFYSHYLSPAQYGIIELIELSTQVVALSFGLQSIGAALGRLFHDQDTPEKEASIVSTAILGTAVLSGLIAIAGVLAAEPLSRAVFHSTDQASLLQAAFVAMWFANMVEVILVYQRIRSRARFFFFYSIVSLAANLSLNIYFIGFAGAGVWGFVYSKLVVTAIGSVFLLYRVLGEVGLHWQKAFIPQFVRFGLPLLAASVSEFVIHFSDRFFLADAVSLAELGKYALAYRFAFLVSVLVGESFARSWNVTLYRFVSEDGWKQRFARIAAYRVFALYLTGLAISLMAPELFSFIVPPSFYPPRLLLPILVSAYLFRETGDFFRTLLLINKRSGTVGKLVFCGAVLNTALNFALIPKFGIYGAACATMGTWGVYMIVVWLIAWREHRVPFSVIAFVKINGLALVIFALGDWLRLQPRFLQVGVDCLWIGLFILLSMRYFFSAEERTELISTVKTQLWRLIAAEPISAEGPGLPTILMLAPSFAPQDAIGAARPGQFAKYLARLGYPVTVLSNHGDDQDTTGRWTRRVLGLFARSMLLHDDRLPWAPHAFRLSTGVLAANPNHVIVSCCPPLAAHLVALALKLRFGSRWVADFRDPLAGNPLRSARRTILLDRRLERAIFRHADVVIANTDAVKQIWQDRYPQWRQKIQLIWDGFDREDPMEPRPVSGRTRRIIAHVGSIYRGHTPWQLIEALDRLVTAGKLPPDSLQLRLLGPISHPCPDMSAGACQRLSALGCLQVEDRMAPQDEAREQMLNADYLVLLDIIGDGFSGIQLPAGIFDCIRAGRPILAFTPAHSVINRVLVTAEVAHACIAPTAPDAAIDAAVLAFLNQPRTAIPPGEAFCDGFDAASRTYILANIISRMSVPATRTSSPALQT